MASTYVNDLRLNEMATGDASGSWGTVTNTNLELIGEAFSYGTETIGDADSTLTIADGAADAARSFYLKITSSVDLTTTRIVTLAPNTVSKVWMIENATTGSQVITIKQGSGATINVPNGQVKMLATDGAGSGGAVLDLLVDVDLTGTTTLVNLDVSGAVDIAGDLTLSAGGDGALRFTAASSVKVLDNDAAALVFEEADNAYMTFVTTDGSEAVKFDKALDINAATQIDATVTVGVDDTGYDVKFFGATAGAYMLWDESADTLEVSGTVTADGLTVENSSLDVVFKDTQTHTTTDGPALQFQGKGPNGTNYNFGYVQGLSNGVNNAGDIVIGTNTAGVSYQRLRIEDNGDISFYEDTGTTAKFFWDASAESLTVTGTVVADGLTVASTSLPRITMSDTDGGFADVTFTVTNGGRDLQITSAQEVIFKDTETAANWLRIDEGDISFYEATGTTAKLTWDASDESLNFADNAKAIFGAGDDLQIYHNANQSFIEDAGTGDLYIRAADNLRIQSYGDNEDMIKAVKDGAVTLYHNNATKLATTATGIDVTGTVVADGLTVSGSATSTFNSGAENVVATFTSTDTEAQINLVDTTGSAQIRSRNDLRFYVNGGSTRAMDIDSSGNLLVGTTGVPNGTSVYGAGFVPSTSDRSNLYMATSSTADLFHIRFFNPNGAVGEIRTNGSATSYITSSDYRLKTDAQPMVGASARVLALKPVNFEWISDGTRVDGFLAHEAQAVVPEAVTGTKDAMRDEEYEVTAAVYEDIIIAAVLDEDGNELEAERTEQRLVSEAVMGTRSVPDYQGIDQSKLVPLLTAALQEALNKIDAMEIRLSALEG
jgi:hypothetical protein